MRPYRMAHPRRRTLAIEVLRGLGTLAAAVAIAAAIWAYLVVLIVVFGN